MRQKLPTPFGPEPTLKEQIGEMQQDHMADKATLLGRELGAVEIEAPEHWLGQGDRFAIFTEGMEIRPDWSWREALILARWCQGMLARLENDNRLSAAVGRPRVHSLPGYLAVVACPHCHELQTAQATQLSAAIFQTFGGYPPAADTTEAEWLKVPGIGPAGAAQFVSGERDPRPEFGHCHICPLRCEQRSKHPAAQRGWSNEGTPTGKREACTCYHKMEEIWNTTQDIPEGWLAYD